MKNINDSHITVRGARSHNLKNLTVRIPHKSITVITGVSGSGKSSLAFDTIFSEGQRRYVESLSNYARQLIDTTERADVDSIDGLSPTISIQQKTTVYNPRSTVGTVTEVYDYLRLLYARVATPTCYKCGNAIQGQSLQQIAENIASFENNSKISILSPIARSRKGEFQKEIAALRTKGFTRAIIDGEDRDLSEKITLDKNKKHSISVYIDRIILRRTGSTADASLYSRILDAVKNSSKLSDGLVEVMTAGEPVLFSTRNSCTDCGISYPDPEPRTFSFNSPLGSCRSCDGLGHSMEEVLADESSGSSSIFVMSECEACHGARLRPESLSYKLHNRNIHELCSMDLVELGSFFSELKLSARSLDVVGRVLKEINDRIRFLINVGVGYLTLGRSTQTLSGGESQRIRLAAQLGSALTGVVYVLDEPSIGLHQRDNDRLLDSLKDLKKNGNTVLVVEHDRDTMRIADYIIDLGPGAGTEGGEIIAEGSFSSIIKNQNSLTGRYLSGELSIPTPSKRRAYTRGALHIEQAHMNNLKNVTVDIPLGVFTCVTGVSGSGKSTLIVDTLYSHLMSKLYKTKDRDLSVKSISGWENLDKVVDIDQSPIGRTPRSNPATYTGIFDLIRAIYSTLPDSKIRGFKPGRFSFNVKGGRCETCQGAGMRKIEMHFMPDVYVLCEVCNGRRFNADTLAIKYKNKNIYDVLNMTIKEASLFFENYPQLLAKLSTLESVGLGYLTLGQSSTKLSGGEAQRVKLATQLSRRATGKTIYILDEPSTGLHFDDIKKLVNVLHLLVDQGNTVIVIEHNLDIIKSADYVIDMGPDGGAGGGHVVAHGSPEEIVRNPNSVTGRYLKDYL
jgi:excinuclease ABC subunit A